MIAYNQIRFQQHSSIKVDGCFCSFITIIIERAHLWILFDTLWSALVLSKRLNKAELLLLLQKGGRRAVKGMDGYRVGGSRSSLSSSRVTASVASSSFARQKTTNRPRRVPPLGQHYESRAMQYLKKRRKVSVIAVRPAAAGQETVSLLLLLPFKEEAESTQEVGGGVASRFNCEVEEKAESGRPHWFQPCRPIVCRGDQERARDFREHRPSLCVRSHASHTPLSLLFSFPSSLRGPLFFPSLSLPLF